MCGIVGFTSFQDLSFDKPKVLEAMADSISYRGPDDHGYHHENQISLGHRRLSIVGLETGQQPMFSFDKKLVIVFNGEIYNYKDLKKNLETKNYKFNTTSDTEVVLNLYKEYGKDFLSKLNGMFAIALWDSEREELILARDRMGEKPLFYQYKNNEIFFASELKALVKHPDCSKAISSKALNKYLTYEYIPSPTTIFENVYKLEAGQVIVVSKDTISKNFYWQHPHYNYIEGNIINSEEQVVAELEALLQDSVAMRMQADVPVGVLLSGGIDSSLVTAVAAKVKKNKEKIKSFSIYFDEKSYDESSYVEKMVSTYDLEHHSQTVQSKDMLSIFDKLGSIMDEPMADPSIVPTYFLSQMTAKTVKTVMGGDGADEIFAGYPTYTANKLVQIYNIIPYELRSKITGLVAAAQGTLLPVSNANISLDFKLKQFFRGAGVASEIRFFKWMGGFLESEKKSVLTEGLQKEILGQIPYEDLNRYLSRTNTQSELDRLLYLSQKLYLQDDILVKVDRASMQNSLEVRAPFLDHRIVEYASLLPERYKLKRFTTKYILKKLAKDYLPAGIIKRPKKGFGIPITQWLKEDLKEPMLDLLSQERLKKQGFFDHQGVSKLIDEHLEGKTNNRKSLWTLLSFQLWYEQMMT